MRKKFFVTALVLSLLFPAFRVSAQERKVESPWGVAVRGGFIGNVYENFLSYIDHSRYADILTTGWAIDGMYDFNPLFGLRLSLATGKNAGSCNSKDSGGAFYPYLFRSVNVFSDAMLHFGTPEDAFSSRIYGGLGFAHSHGLERVIKDGVTGWPHPWATAESAIPMTREPNTVLGFRLGYLGEWHITPELGVLMDACAEFYGDAYDCLTPTSDDQEKYLGYGGFPFDMRFILSLGVVYRF